MNPAELLLGHFDRIAGPGEPMFYPISDAEPKITVAVYANSPKEGWFTAFTIGLSHEHPHRELTIRMDSGDDISWALAVGFVADQLRGRAPFDSGEVINFREEISPASRMNAFVVGHEAMIVDIGVRKIEIMPMIPIFEEERVWLLEDGSVEELLRKLPQGEWLNPRRTPAIRAADR